MKTANPFRSSLPSLRALTRHLRTIHRAVTRTKRAVAPDGFDLWVRLVPTCLPDQFWQVMAGAKSKEAELIPAEGRFDAVASARRLLARARDGAAYRAGPRQ